MIRQVLVLLVNASAHLRDRYRALPETKLMSTLAVCRPDQVQTGDDADILYALRTLARRYRDLAVEIDALGERILAKATTANPPLMAIKESALCLAPSC